MDKWACIMIAIVFSAMFAPLAIQEHGRAECRIEAIKAGFDADKINQACGIK